MSKTEIPDLAELTSQLAEHHRLAAEAHDPYARYDVDAIADILDGATYIPVRGRIDWQAPADEHTDGVS